MKKLVGKVLFSAFIFLLPSFSFAEAILIVKYRSSPVDVDQPYFEHKNTSKSSLVKEAWYDASKQYMIINLSSTNYQYCGIDKETWEMFKVAESYGSFYTHKIKGHFDCRVHPEPSYR